MPAAACLLFPPKRIPKDRALYIEAINKSWKEQLLGNLVRLRHGDTLTFLELKEVITSYSLKTKADANYTYNWGNIGGAVGTFTQAQNVDEVTGERTGEVTETRTKGLTLPSHSVYVGGGIDYGRDPKITYTPIRGEKLRKAMMNPIPLGSVLNALQTGWDHRFVFSCLIDSINNLQNRSPGGTCCGDTEYFKFMELFGKLRRQGVIRITIEPVEGMKKDVTVTYAPDKPAAPTPQPSHARPDSSGTSSNVAQNGRVRSKKANKNPNNRNQGGQQAQEKLKIKKKDIKTTTEKKDVGYYAILIDKSRAENTNDLEKFRKYLNLKEKEVAKYTVQFGTQLIGKNKQVEEIFIQTRSVMQVLTMLSQCISMPSESVPDLPYSYWSRPSNLVGKSLDKPIVPGDQLEPPPYMFRVLYSEKEPETSFAQVWYPPRKHYFYIESMDYWSKDIFTSTMTILSMYEPVTEGGAQVTIPVK